MLLKGLFFIRTYYRYFWIVFFSAVIVIGGCLSTEAQIPIPQYGIHFICIDSVERAEIYLRRINHVSSELIRNIHYDPPGMPKDTSTRFMQYYLQKDGSVLRVLTAKSFRDTYSDTIKYDPFDRNIRQWGLYGEVRTVVYDDAKHTAKRSIFNNYWLNENTGRAEKTPFERTQNYYFDMRGNLLRMNERKDGRRLEDFEYTYDSLGRYCGSTETRYRLAGDAINCCDSSVKSVRITKSHYDNHWRIRVDSMFQGLNGTLPSTVGFLWDESNRVNKCIFLNGDVPGSLSPAPDTLDRFGRRSNGTIYDERGLEKIIESDDDGKPFNRIEYEYEYALPVK
jgi:hypothetical protein